MAGFSLFERIRRWYTASAVIALNTVVLAVLVNLLALLALWWLDRGRPSSSHRYERAWLIEAYGFETLARAYPGFAHHDLEEFLYETSNWFNEFEPFTGFRPVERHDRFITIDRAGFRPVPQQGPWPPDRQAFNVFLFGGSTMMGAGVPDDQTIAAHVQRTLADCRRPVRVYNFGRGYYFSTQERILFEQHLLSGRVPDAAIFLDGLNDFYYADGIPEFTPQFARLMAEGNTRTGTRGVGASVGETARALPLLRLLSRMGVVRTTPSPIVEDRAADESSGRPADEMIDDVIARWRRNKEMIESVAHRHGVNVLMVWQPVPTYGYDVTALNVYRPAVDLFGRHRLSGIGYQRVGALAARSELGMRVLWLGDLQRNRSENLYVDAVHYTGGFSAEIAERIAAFATAHAIVPCDHRQQRP